jgi:hypothetical protein
MDTWQNKVLLHYYDTAVHASVFIDIKLETDLETMMRSDSYDEIERTSQLILRDCSGVRLNRSYEDTVELYFLSVV